MGDGVDDEEGEVGDGLDGGFEEGKGRRGSFEFRVSSFKRDEGVEVFEEVDVLEVGVEGLEFGDEGVGGVVFGGEEEGGGGSFEFRVSSFKRRRGRGSPRERCAARERARVVFPEPGSAARRVILPRGMRGCQSHWRGLGGCWRGCGCCGCWVLGWCRIALECGIPPL